MIPAPRPPVGPLPGDLYLDPAVPECERVTLSRNGWSAEVSHVWTGTGWTRIVPGVVKAVPTGQPATERRVASASADQAVVAWRERKRKRETGLVRKAREASEAAERIVASAQPDPAGDWERASAG